MSRVRSGVARHRRRKKLLKKAKGFWGGRHALFKSAVSKYRPELDLDRVATGEHWYGTRALELGLADEIRTSDELLLELAEERDLYHLSYKIKQPLQKRLMSNIDGAIEKVDAVGWRRRFEARLPRSPWN